MTKDNVELKNKGKEIKREWRKFIKKEDFADYFAFYKAIRNTAQSMIFQMIDCLFIEDVYTAFLELLELNNNIEIMLNAKDYETVQLCKERIDYLFVNKVGNWYI